MKNEKGGKECRYCLLMRFILSFSNRKSILYIVSSNWTLSLGDLDHIWKRYYVISCVTFYCFIDKANMHYPFFQHWQVIEAGANALVAGSAVFGAKDYAEGMAKLKLLSPKEKKKKQVNPKAGQLMYWYHFYCFDLTLPAIKGIKNSKKPVAVAVWNDLKQSSFYATCDAVFLIFM